MQEAPAQTSAGPWMEFASDPVQSPAVPESQAGTAVANAASKGFSVGGLGRDLAPMVSAAFPTATDEAMNRDYGDRLLTAKSQMDKSAAETEAKYPGTSIVTQLLAAAPKAIAMTGVLDKLGVISGAAQGAIQGGLEGLTQSKKDSAGQIIKDTAVGGAVGAVVGKAFDAYGNVMKSSQMAQSVDEFGNALGKEINPNAVGVKVLPRENGEFDIKFGNDFKSAMKLSAEESKFLGDPELQALVTDRRNQVQPQIDNLVFNTKKNLGKAWDPLLKEHGAAPVNVKPALENLYKQLEEIAPENNEVVQRAKDALLARLDNTSKALLTKSPTSTHADVPMAEVAKSMEELGEVVFGQGAYANAPSVNRVAQKSYFALKDAFNAADGTSGSGGQLAKINDVFASLYKMRANNKLTGSAIKSLTSPNADAARRTYQKFVDPFLKLDPSTRASLAPELQEYLATELPNVINQSSAIKAVTSHKDSTGGLGWVLNKMYLNKPTALKIAGGLSALRSKAGNLPNMSLPSAPDMSGLRAFGPGLSATGLTTINQSDMSNEAGFRPVE